MENKKYIDKVIGSLVRSTKIDYENEIIHFPSLFLTSVPFSHFLLSSSFFLLLFSSFSNHCKNTFGLTEEEIKYVWKEYKSIIEDKINR